MVHRQMLGQALRFEYHLESERKKYLSDFDSPIEKKTHRNQINFFKESFIHKTVNLRPLQQLFVVCMLRIL